MKVIVTSVGSLSGTFVVKRLKELGYYVIGTNSEKLSSLDGHLECDEFFIVPHSKSILTYKNAILNLVNVSKASKIIPLTDPEVWILSEISSQLRILGCQYTGPTREALCSVMDKQKLAERAELITNKTFKTIPTYQIGRAHV